MTAVSSDVPHARIIELEARSAQQAAFIRLLNRNGEAILARIGQDLLDDLQRSLEAARNEKEQYNQSARLLPSHLDSPE